MLSSAVLISGRQITFVHCQLLRSNYILYPVKSVAVFDKTTVLAFKSHLWSLLGKDFLLSHHQQLPSTLFQMHQSKECNRLRSYADCAHTGILPGPLPRSACGPGYEATTSIGVWSNSPYYFLMDFTCFHSVCMCVSLYTVRYLKATATSWRQRAYSWLQTRTNFKPLACNWRRRKIRCRT